MKTLFWTLGAIALLVLLGGALNHGTEVSLDYLVGSTHGVSLFWSALAVAVAVLVVGLVGWSVGRAGGGDARGKLERELESTYRRLRDCEAQLPRPALPPAGEAATAVAPTPADEAATAVAPAPADETVTAVAPAAPGEAVTAVAPAPPEEPSADDAPSVP